MLGNCAFVSSTSKTTQSHQILELIKVLLISSQVSISAFGGMSSTLYRSFLGPTFRICWAFIYICFGLSAIFSKSHSILLQGSATKKKDA